MFRSLKWAIRVLAAAALGAVMRAARRALRKRPRIWHGFWPLHTAADHALVDRQAGYPSQVVALQLSQFGYEILPKERVDVVWEHRGVPPRDRHWRSLEHLLLHGDIWVAFFDCLFFPGRERLNRLSFQLVRLAGIRIIAVTQGGDVVHKPRWTTRFDWVGRWQQSYPNWDLAAQAPVARQRIDTFSRFASFVIADGAYTARFLPRVDLIFKYFPVDTETFRATPPPPHERPLLVHATNHRPVKGTDFVLASSARLAALGFDHELRLVEKVPRLEAIEIYKSADIIADQFCMGSFGCFAMEALSLGRPVVSYSDQEELGMPQFNVPLVNANRDNLDEVLAALIALPELRSRLAVAAANGAERTMSFSALAEIWDRIYRHVWWDEPLDLTSTAIYSPERKPRPFTEDPADEEFWPVDVHELIPRIRELVARVRASSAVPR